MAEILSGTVTAGRRGDAWVLTVDNPPLNVLSASVRQGILRGLRAAAEDPAVRAVVMICAGQTAFSGADLRELGGPIARPDLPALAAAVAASAKPVTVALHGRALGGGFEIALAAASRVAAPDARMGLPELRLGLIPGCGGLERVTRMAGVEAALDLCLSGREIGAAEARALGLVDAVAEGGLLEAALDLARRGVGRRAPAADPEAAAKVAAWRGRNAFRLRGQTAPGEALALIEAAAADPAADLRDRAAAAFHRLEQGPQSAALRHLFAAERRARELPFLPEGTAALPVDTLGVVGAGTMGSGIATAGLLAGLRVILHDTGPEGLARGRELIAANLAGAVRRGKLDEAGRAAALARLTAADSLEAMAAADLVIEAVYESLPLKQEVFARLDAVTRPGVILATNTSFLDIDAIAAATRRPERVLGLHFFSPAHVMKLLEVVRGAATAPEVLATAMALGRRLGKIAVCVGNCPGFVGNRILARRQAAAMELLLDGASPYAIDAAMVEFGLPMGPFGMHDLAGMDVGWDRATTAGRTVEEVFCEAGRLGRKNGAGYYDYDADGAARPSPEALALIAAFRARTGRTGAAAAELGRKALCDRLLAPMLEETGRIIAEGIALRPSDIDVIWVHGYGWPAWRGGPAWYREHGEG